MTIQAYSVSTTTGDVIDRIPVSVFTGDRLLAAKGTGSATVQLDGSYTKLQLRDLFAHWSRTLVLERDDEIKYAGIIVPSRGYELGSNKLTLSLVDLWGLWERRGAWDHSAPNVEKWKTAVTGSLAHHAGQAVVRGRTGPALPVMSVPVTVPGFGGASVSRTYYGYHLETVADVISDLMAEGLDVDFKPRWVDGRLDWLMRAGVPFSTGVVHELYPTLPGGNVTGFSEVGDGSRVTNNARNVGEGSEEDMLVRSQRNTASPYPLLDRSTERKNVSDVGQLSALSGRDLVTYEHPTFQWDFSLPASMPIDLGDTVHMFFDGDPWIADGRHDRRVVKVSHGVGETITVGVQPTGGA